MPREARRPAAQAARDEQARSSPWEHAIPAPTYILGTDGDDGADFLVDRLLARGAITELFSPRGLGKTNVLHAVLVELARAGRRVLLVDRDNPRREVKRRLRAWGAEQAPRLHVIGREHAPPLTDAAAWAAFPLDTYDVVAIDSLDASSEGVGEGDSAKPSKALAAALDLARRRDGPAVAVLGNVIKSGAHSRGCGVIEDRADIVYEVRDATALRPTGTKDWWHELPPAGVEAWASRASRRTRRDTYRLAFVPSKFRLGEEPDPFVYEVDHRPTPWILRDVTSTLIAAGVTAREETAQAHRDALTNASDRLLDEIRLRQDTDKPPLTLTAAEALLRARGLTRKAARALLTQESGWGPTSRVGEADGRDSESFSAISAAAPSAVGEIPPAEKMGV